MNKDILRKLIEHYQGGCVKFFDTLSSTLYGIGDEWIAHGRKEWGTAFYECSAKLDEIVISLSKLEDEFKEEQSK